MSFLALKKGVSTKIVRLRLSGFYASGLLFPSNEYQYSFLFYDKLRLKLQRTVNEGRTHALTDRLPCTYTLYLPIMSIYSSSDRTKDV